MAKKAFLLGCNSAGLKHCERDVQLMDEALTTHGYEITQLTEVERIAPSWKLLPHLSKFLESCGAADTVIVYFAGHSLNLGKGKFYLVLADDINNFNNRLKAGELLDRLRDECKAADKLLILDCCEAAKAATDYSWDEEAGEHFRIFTATSSKQTALEIDEICGGGLFTAWLYRALTVEAGQLADADGYLRINRLDDHLQHQARGYHSPGGRPAPVPRLYGSTDKKIILTDKITTRSNPTTGYPRSLMSELKSLLTLQRPTSEQIQQCFDACRAQSDPAIPPGPTDDLNRLVDYLDLEPV